MFISKEEYEKLRQDSSILQSLKDGVRPCASPLEEFFGGYTNQKQYDEITSRFKTETISFSSYYTERLEYWKTKFDKKPRNHEIKIFYAGEIEVIEFKSEGEMLSRLIRLRGDLNNTPEKEIEVNGSFIIKTAINEICPCYYHPDPYTPAEIEAWAKEQLEKEMQSWKVVKPGWKVEDVRPALERLIIQKQQNEYANQLFLHRSCPLTNHPTGGQCITCYRRHICENINNN